MKILQFRVLSKYVVYGIIKLSVMKFMTDEVKESTFVGSIAVKSSKPIMKYIIGSSTLVAFSLGLLFLIIFNFIKSIIML